MRRTFRHVGFTIALTATAIASTTSLAGATSPRPRDTQAGVQVDSDLRQLAVAEETLLTDTLHYGSWNQLATDSYVTTPTPVPGEALRIVWYTKHSSYCLKGTDVSYAAFYASTKGGLRPAGKTCGHRPARARSGGTRSG